MATGTDALMALAEPAVAVVRWAARVYGLLLVGLFGLFAVGEGYDPSVLTPSGLVACALASGALAGLLVAWRWELTGGLMVVGGMVAFGLWGVVQRGRWGWSGWVFWSVLAVGAVFAAAALAGRAAKATPA